MIGVELPEMTAFDIKICGLSQPGSVDAAVAGAATHVGFIFFEKSPRNVTPENAAALSARVSGKAISVAVTVDARDAILDEIVAVMKPGMLQLHGVESPERVSYVKHRYYLPVMKAFAVRTREDLQGIGPWLGTADRFLFDAKPPAGSQLPGGNGLAFDWSLLEGLDPGIPYMLSGGINVENAGQALRASRACGLDVSSGVESSRGVKDDRLIAEFLTEMKHLTKSMAV